MNPLELVRSRLEQHDCRPQGRERLEARCPAHDDHRASLSVGAGSDGRILLHCHAGCEPAAVLETLGLGWQDLYPDQPGGGHGQIAATYDYASANGELLYQVVRFEPKGFAQRRPDGAGGWDWRLGDVHRVLYRLPAVLAAAREGGTIYIAEGEKDVHALERAGRVATCNPGGAGKWRAHYAEALAGASVTVIADRDESGRRHAQAVASSARTVAAEVRVLEPTRGKDISDHLRAGGELSELVPLTEAADVAPDASARLLTGAQFVLDAPTTQAAIWGSGQEILWSEGEGVYVTGPLGVGKSTLLQQLIAGRLGLRDELLGMPIANDGRSVLLIAADRPAQIRRSMLRMFGEPQRKALAERLRVHRGALPFDVTKAPELLVELVGDAGTVFIDSLKDIASPLSSDEVGAAVNRALQLVIEAGAQVCALHHHRKASSENKKPSKLSDVYGSVWLTAGAGSVVTLWGEAGDPVVELLHLKSPAEEVGPFEIEHDHERGETIRRAHFDAWALLHCARADGTTARAVAAAVHDTAEPSRGQVEKARRKLEGYVRRGHATRIEPAKDGDPVHYAPTAETMSVTDRDVGVRGSRDPHAPHDPVLARVTQGHGGLDPHAAPIEGAEREGCDELLEDVSGGGLIDATLERFGGES